MKNGDRERRRAALEADVIAKAVGRAGAGCPEPFRSKFLNDLLGNVSKPHDQQDLILAMSALKITPSSEHKQMFDRIVLADRELRRRQAEGARASRMKRAAVQEFAKFLELRTKSSSEQGDTPEQILRDFNKSLAEEAEGKSAEVAKESEDENVEQQSEGEDDSEEDDVD